jgi:hypothetical protein
MLQSWSKLEGYNQGGCQVFFQGYGGHSYFLGIKCLYEYNIQNQTTVSLFISKTFAVLMICSGISVVLVHELRSHLL